MDKKTEYDRVKKPTSARVFYMGIGNAYVAYKFLKINM